MKTAKTMKTITDRLGNKIPVRYISAYELDKDVACRRIRARFLKAREILEKTIAESLEDIEKLEAKHALSRAARGNLQISSFDGLIKVCIDQCYNIVLDARVSEARKIMLDYAERLASGLKSDHTALLKIINTAFDANRFGLLPYTKILALLKLDIDSADWQRARKLLIDSITTSKGRAYLSCEARETTQVKFKRILLDSADCWPQEQKED